MNLFQKDYWSVMKIWHDFQKKSYGSSSKSAKICKEPRTVKEMEDKIHSCTTLAFASVYEAERNTFVPMFARSSSKYGT